MLKHIVFAFQILKKKKLFTEFLFCPETLLTKLGVNCQEVCTSYWQTESGYYTFGGNVMIIGLIQKYNLNDFPI